MPRPPVEARRATPADVDDLVLLWSLAREEVGRQGRPLSQPPLEQFRVRLLEALTGSDAIVLLGRCEGAAAGFAVLRLSTALLSDPGGLHVDQLFVLPAMRRRGVARALLLLTASIAERHGVEQVLAGAPQGAREAHRFLARLGFSPLSLRRVVGTTALRRRLAGEGQRRGLEELLSRRRSLRARSLRAGWGRQEPIEPLDDDGSLDEPPRRDGAWAPTPGAVVRPDRPDGPSAGSPDGPSAGSPDGPSAGSPAGPSAGSPDGQLQRVDLSDLTVAAGLTVPGGPAVDAGPGPAGPGPAGPLPGWGTPAAPAPAPAPADSARTPRRGRQRA